MKKRGFSPRPWGWSGNSIMKTPNAKVFPAPVGMVRIQYRQFLCEKVFPAPVGMVRSNIGVNGKPYSFPRARGDGPQNDE